MGQMGFPADCARALEDHAMACRIAPDRAVGTILGAIRGRWGRLLKACAWSLGLPGNL